MALSLASGSAGKIPSRTVQGWCTCTCVQCSGLIRCVIVDDLFWTCPANDGPIYTLERAEKLLVYGGEGGISAWKLDDLTKTSKVCRFNHVCVCVCERKVAS